MDGEITPEQRTEILDELFALSQSLGFLCEKLCDIGAEVDAGRVFAAEGILLSLFEEYSYTEKEDSE